MSATTIAEEEAESLRNASRVRILRLPEVMSIVGLRRAHIYQMLRAGSFPRRVKIGVRAVGWIDREVHAWVAKRTHQSDWANSQPISRETEGAEGWQSRNAKT